MRLYEGRTLMTNPRKVTLYLAEKGIEIERVVMDMRGGQGLTPEYLAKNPAGMVPILELEDGTFLSESAPIIEFLEELNPEPPMIGRTPVERARTRAADRIAGDFVMRNGGMLSNTHPFIPSVRPGYVQYPEIVPAFKGYRDKFLKLLEDRLAAHAFVAGDQVTIADCTLFSGLQVHHQLWEYEIPTSAPNLRRWYERFAERPSAPYTPPAY
jgi:glutathione S-transferase